MARVFAVQAQAIWDIRVSWVVKWLEGCEVVMVFQNCLGGKAQCRGRTCLEGSNLSWLQEFGCEQCADPGAALIPELSWQQEPLRKNRDKQLTFIVRVMCRLLIQQFFKEFVIDSFAFIFVLKKFLAKYHKIGRV